MLEIKCDVENEISLLQVESKEKLSSLNLERNDLSNKVARLEGEIDDVQQSNQDLQQQLDSTYAEVDELEVFPRIILDDPPHFDRKSSKKRKILS